MATVKLPHQWQPRLWQRNLYNNFGYGKQFQRGAAVWHRRAGKDSTALNITARDMFKRVGTYWHLLPEQTQARKVVWNGIDAEGRRIVDQFLPPEVRVRKSEQEMLVETVNGSIWQLAGSDNYDALVGSNPVGVVFSEWALADPAAWDYIRPILAENGGWALFIYTPRGRNHGYQTLQMALGADTWFAERLTVDDTGAINEAAIEDERRAGMSDAKIAQEFYCSFEAENEEQFIPTTLVAEARQRKVEVFTHDETVIGVDVARFGDDRTVIAVRRGRDAHSEPWQVFRDMDTMQVVGRVSMEIDRLKPDAVFIDEGNMGAGVVDRLRQLGYSVFGVNFGAKPSGLTEAKVANKRAEMWARMREWLDGGAIPDNDELEFELAGVGYKFNANNEIVLERKEDMKKRGAPSPDMADALALTFAYPVVRSEVWGALDWRDEHADDGRSTAAGY